MSESDINICIIFKDSSYNTLNLQLINKETVLELKRLIQKSTNVPIDCIKLMCDGIEMNDSTVLTKEVNNSEFICEFIEISQDQPKILEKINKVDVESINFLTSLQYPKDQAEKALISTNGNLSNAVTLLQTRSVPIKDNTEETEEVGDPLLLTPINPKKLLDFKPVQSENSMESIKPPYEDFMFNIDDKSPKYGKYAILGLENADYSELINYIKTHDTCEDDFAVYKRQLVYVKSEEIKQMDDYHQTPENFPNIKNLSETFPDDDRKLILYHSHLMTVGDFMKAIKESNLPSNQCIQEISKDWPKITVKDLKIILEMRNFSSVRRNPSRTASKSTTEESDQIEKNSEVDDNLNSMKNDKILSNEDDRNISIQDDKNKDEKNIINSEDKLNVSDVIMKNSKENDKINSNDDVESEEDDEEEYEEDNSTFHDHRRYKPREESDKYAFRKLAYELNRLTFPPIPEEHSVTNDLQRYVAIIPVSIFKMIYEKSQSINSVNSLVRYWTKTFSVVPHVKRFSVKTLMSTVFDPDVYLPVDRTSMSVKKINELLMKTQGYELALEKFKQKVCLRTDKAIEPDEETQEINKVEKTDDVPENIIVQNEEYRLLHPENVEKPVMESIVVQRVIKKKKANDKATTSGNDILVPLKSYKAKPSKTTRKVIIKTLDMPNLPLPPLDNDKKDPKIVKKRRAELNLPSIQSLPPFLESGHFTSPEPPLMIPPFMSIPAPMTDQNLIGARDNNRTEMQVPNLHPIPDEGHSVFHSLADFTTELRRKIVTDDIVRELYDKSRHNVDWAIMDFYKRLFQ